MRITANILLFAFLFSLTTSCGKKVNSSDLSSNESLGTCGAIKQKVVYGTDDRKDYYESTDKLKEVSKSVAALVSSSRLIYDDINKEYFHGGYTFEDIKPNLCNNEPFKSQFSLAYCTTFLVAPDIMITAGHCIVDEDECANSNIVFDFKVETSESAQSGPDVILEENVYSCASVIHQESHSNKRYVDFTVIKLDRPVVGRTPLKVRKSGQITTATRTIVMGHPVGLPLKIENNGIVRDSVGDGYFVSEMDTFQGNSGSPVINSYTLEVEGILIRGEVDFKENIANSCYETKVCPSGTCSGEYITKILEVYPYFSGNISPETVSSSNSCRFANDNICDDGRVGAPFAACASGTDEDDCEGFVQNLSCSI